LTSGRNFNGGHSGFAVQVFLQAECCSCRPANCIYSAVKLNVNNIVSTLLLSLLLRRIAVLRNCVDAACCYRPSSVVCRSVRRSVTLVIPAKKGCTDRDSVWVEDSGGPKEPCVQMPPMERAILFFCMVLSCLCFSHCRCSLCLI